MDRAQKYVSPTVFVFLDAQKAFDRMEWQYLNCTLKRFGIWKRFGPYLREWIDILYQKQIAIVVMEGQLSSKIRISCDVRQGCPLFPLLFNIA